MSKLFFKEKNALLQARNETFLWKKSFSFRPKMAGRTQLIMG